MNDKEPYLALNDIVVDHEVLEKIKRLYEEDRDIEHREDIIESFGYTMYVLEKFADGFCATAKFDESVNEDLVKNISNN